MLSDARYMVGGETELEKADGTTLKVKAPQMVSVNVPRDSTDLMFSGLRNSSSRTIYHPYRCANREHAGAGRHCYV